MTFLHGLSIETILFDVPVILLIFDLFNGRGDSLSSPLTLAELFILGLFILTGWLVDSDFDYACNNFDVLG